MDKVLSLSFELVIYDILLFHSSSPTYLSTFGLSCTEFWKLVIKTKIKQLHQIHKQQEQQCTFSISNYKASKYNNIRTTKFKSVYEELR